ncbi:hypothetical protein CR513_06448, partial [Mucuna pruriens]
MRRRAGTTPSPVKYLIVAVDYFTKWIKVESVATVSKIICRFGLPVKIVSEMGHSLPPNNGEFLHSIKNQISNGQAKAANKIILRGLRRRLEEAKGRWVEELPQVLWSYHTMPHSSTNETPFRLTFDTEAVILVEIGELLTVGGPRGGTNNKIRDKGTCGQATMRLSSRQFKSQDLVLRKITWTVNDNNMTPNWEGPFRVIERVGKGAYHLEHLDGKKIPRTWNMLNL